MPAQLVEKARSIPTMAGLDLASRVSTPERYEWIKPVEPCSPSDLVGRRPQPQLSRGGLRFRHQAQHSAPPGAGRLPRHRGPRAHLAPKTCWRSIPTASSSPTAPAIPNRSQTQVGNIRKLIGKKPIFGICLGHQLLGLALGGKTYKLKFGHRGANHPVRNEVTNKVEITSHNHGFAVDPDSLNLNEVEITHMNLNDQTLEGFRHRNHPVFCVQYHPEAAPGPHDSHYLFDDFMKLMSGRDNRMPRRNDLHRILIIGSGPIIIGQACEFDYSGTQAAKALRADGYEVILVNSNPATIMTDPDLADRTYVEPLTLPVPGRDHPPRTARRAALHRGRPDRPEPLRGTGRSRRAGQVRRGTDRRQDRRHQEGRRPPAVQGRHAQDRPGNAAIAAGQHRRRRPASSPSASAIPCILRPSFTLGGTGGGIAYNQRGAGRNPGARASTFRPVHEVLIEESALGWKEFELEVMRDLADNCIIVCSIENFDPMGVHTGDSITVAPAQTLTDREYQMMRDGAIRCLREIGVDTGGSNVQFAINPPTAAW